MLPVLSSELRIGIVGLGYVGLPLAIAFAEKYSVIGYDINVNRVIALNTGYDSTQQVTEAELKKSTLKLSSTYESLVDCQIYIITVPTPVTFDKRPDLTALVSSSKVVGSMLKKGDIIIYESTVYPGCTEEDCVPILEEASKLRYNIDFYCGYSPERISPGDAIRTLKNIIKVTSGSTAEVAHTVDELYGSIITAGTHKAPSIIVAEASKAIENAQRDVNISFVNELALIFDKMNVDTTDVLEAAGTKWNFLPFKPGLVGGHCIGVDPYYLSYKAQSLGYSPQVILSGREVNDGMARFVVSKSIKLLSAKGIELVGSRALVLGITFKENCPDIRNTMAVEIVNELCEFGLNVDVHDPVADVDEVKAQYNLSLIGNIYAQEYQLIILAVAHDQFFALNYEELKKAGNVFFDTRSKIDKRWVDARL